MKLAVFDLDNTLADLGKGITAENVKLLKKLEQSGVKIAICSGKPTYYLCGFMRQVELKDCILIGENGAVIQFGVDLPPREFHKLPYPKEADRQIKEIHKAIERQFPELWYQPNVVGLTPFPKNEEEFDWIASYLKDYQCSMRTKGNVLDVYRHVDSFDIVPVGISKKAGLEYLSKLTEIMPDETVAIGDGVNDYPMFEYAGLRMGINLKEPWKVDYNYTSVTNALEDLLKMCRDEASMCSL